jgi:hypothetical protein
MFDAMHVRDRGSCSREDELVASESRYLADILYFCRLPLRESSSGRVAQCRHVPLASLYVNTSDPPRSPGLFTAAYPYRPDDDL